MQVLEKVDIKRIGYKAFLPTPLLGNFWEGSSSFFCLATRVYQTKVAVTPRNEGGKRRKLNPQKQKRGINC